MVRPVWTRQPSALKSGKPPEPGGVCDAINPRLLVFPVRHNLVAPQRAEVLRYRRLVSVNQLNELLDCVLLATGEEVNQAQSRLIAECRHQVRNAVLCRHLKDPHVPAR